MRISSLAFIFCFSIFMGMAQKPTPVYLDDSKPIEERIEHALSLMTPEEKVALCHGQSKFSSAGVSRLGIPEVWTSDGPHGVREEFLWDKWAGAGYTNDSCTAYPALTCLAATFNPNIAFLYGKSIGEEARYRNKTVLLAPGVNIYRTPLNGRNFEYMGEDPLLTSRMAVQYVKGVQKNGVAACVKHFALNNQEHDRFNVDVYLSERALREIYLPAFKASVKEANAWSIMGAYNKFRGQHCCHNDYLLNKILKQEWQFDGVVFSDWGGTHDTNESVYNGLDIEMGTGKPFNQYYLADPFLKGLKEGTYLQDLLDDKVRRILRMVYRTTMDRNRPYGNKLTPEHKKAARDIAAQGIVLLQNNKGVLPINGSTVKNIAVIGENAVRMMTVGGGSSSLKVAEEISPLRGLQERFGSSAHITYSKGYDHAYYKKPKEGDDALFRQKSDSLHAAAVELARSADMVIFIGGLNKDGEQDSEGGDRSSFELPYNQSKLISDIAKVNKQTVVVLLTGNAVAMPWKNEVQVIVQAWYLGSQAGYALSDVLSGDVNPSGKLPFTFGVNLADYGAHAFGAESYPGINRTVTYKEDILVGYRWFDTKNIEPAFPFGYGLSYTSFSISKPEEVEKAYRVSDTISVKVNITNTGKVAGAEVVQLYVAKPESKVVRAAKELKAFQKVFLQPGESQLVTLKVAACDLAFYNEEQKDWEVETGEYRLLLGNSSRNLLHKVMCKVEKDYTK
jgi:beta-glucosidase